MTSITENFFAFVKDLAPDLAFTALEIGARKMEGETEPVHQLINTLPNAKLVGFEPDDHACKELNENSSDQFTFYPTALSDKQGTAPFYETVHPMCASLYEPNALLLERYNGMDVAELQRVSELTTATLDHFASEHLKDATECIKIDVQGAELDIFQGGLQTLKDVLFIVTEVEFVELYHNQPLFGDVSSFLQSQGFMFHKFLGLAGRTLKPIILGGDANTASQHMWADAIFIRDLNQFDSLTSEQLLITGALAFIYGSPDLTHFCLENYEKLNPGTAVAAKFIDIITITREPAN